MTPAFTTDIWLARDETTGWYHAYARCIWGTPERCRSEMETVLHGLADGRMAVIRVAPTVNTETDFDAKAVIHHGAVRFSFRTEPGDWTHPREVFEQYEGFGLKQAKESPDALDEGRRDAPHEEGNH